MEIRTGTLKSFDVGTYTATVQLTGSLAVYLENVTVSRGLPSVEMVLGRRCVIVFIEVGNPLDAIMVGINE